MGFLLSAFGLGAAVGALTAVAIRRRVRAGHLIIAAGALRPTTRGGHLAAYEAVRAQLDPPMGSVLRPFDRMRRQRHDAESPPSHAPQLTTDDVHEDIPKADAVVDLAQRILDQMSPF